MVGIQLGKRRRKIRIRNDLISELVIIERQ